jgi:cytidylate kinase
VRSQRRYEEMRARGENVDPAQVERDLQVRDERDLNRADAPLRRAVDAVYVDSKHLSACEVAEAIIAHVRADRPRSMDACRDD